MKQVSWTLLGISVALLFGSVAPALAQYPATRGGTATGLPYQGPAVNPIINLNRRGTSPGVNYYGIVRPQLDFNNSIQQLQMQSALTQQAVTSEAEANLPVTGHPVQFQSQAKYFQTVNRGAQLNRTALTATPVRPALPAMPGGSLTAGPIGRGPSFPR